MGAMAGWIHARQSLGDACRGLGSLGPSAKADDHPIFYCLCVVAW